MESVKIVARVFGVEGHRQRHSFMESYPFTDNNGVHFIVRNSDLTGTNDYTELEIHASNKALCLSALEGQVSDGIFENCRVGRVVVL